MTLTIWLLYYDELFCTVSKFIFVIFLITRFRVCLFVKITVEVICLYSASFQGVHDVDSSYFIGNIGVYPASVL